MGDRGHETLEHTADIGVRGWGALQADALEEIALAMFGVIADTGSIGHSRSAGIEASGNDLEELLVEFLNALISMADLADMAFSSVKVERLVVEDGVWSLKATAMGDPREECIESINTEVKAATWYGVRFAKEHGGIWVAQCVLDI